MLRVIAVCTGTKYSQWYVDNLKHMVDTYSNLEYTAFEVITNNKYDDERGVFNKIQMFDMFRDGQNIYFDLDILIKGDCNHFLRDELHVLHAHWRPPFHTPLNSSIISWKGDVSYVSDFVEQDPEYYMFKYNRGIDQLLFENIEPKRYTKDDKYCSFQTELEEKDEYSVYLFNQRYKEMVKDSWYQKYFISNPTL